MSVVQIWTSLLVTPVCNVSQMYVDMNIKVVAAAVVFTLSCSFDILYTMISDDNTLRDTMVVIVMGKIYIRQNRAAGPHLPS